MLGTGHADKQLVRRNWSVIATHCLAHRSGVPSLRPVGRCNPTDVEVWVDATPTDALPSFVFEQRDTPVFLMFTFFTLMLYWPARLGS